MNIFERVFGLLMVYLLFFVLFGGVIAGFALKSISSVSEWHWIAGVSVGVVWLIGLGVFFFFSWYALRPSASPALRKYFLLPKKASESDALPEHFPAASMGAMICSAILITAMVFASLSRLLADEGVLSYSGGEPTVGSLFVLYIWHTVDIVPFIDVWKVYDFRPPNLPIDIWSQTGVLVFRSLLVGVGVLTLMRLVSLNIMRGSNRV